MAKMRLLAAIVEGVRRGNREADMLRDGWQVARRRTPIARGMSATWYWREETRDLKNIRGRLRVDFGAKRSDDRRSSKQ